MKFMKGNRRVIYLQLSAWASAILLTFFSALPMDGYTRALIYTSINSVFYALIIYGNILFLYPAFYQRGKLLWYIILVILFISLAGIARGYISIVAYNHILQDYPRVINFGALINYIPAGILVFMLSLIFRVAIAYFTLKQQADEILVQKSEAELNLLKSQVQPHFLFNTLNNIYYEAYKESPRTAELIERLSGIMRYFVDESPKDRVPIKTEVQFLENYISLEKIRLRYEVEIKFKMEFDVNLQIPPMLLMTFVENIFKHGIDKSSLQNKISISLIQENGYLHFKTINPIFDIASNKPNGFGIVNLRKRLGMLYRSDFELYVDKTDKIFTAYLKIPVR
jgi:sensor histidine kinase YesM